MLEADFQSFDKKNSVKYAKPGLTNKALKEHFFTNKDQIVYYCYLKYNSFLYNYR